MADNPNDNIFPQILALLAGEDDRGNSTDSVNATPDSKGVIKDSERKRELPATLSSTEEGRVDKIGTVLARAIGRELQIGKYAPGPEAGRLSMDQTKIGSAIGDKGKPPAAPPGKVEGLNLADLLKNLLPFLNLAWPAALLAIGVAAAKLYDDLGALGRGLSKIALKLAPHLDTIAKLGGKLFSGIGRVVSGLSDIFKYFSEKGLTGFLDDLKRKLPKTAEFIEKTGKYWDDFKTWFSNKWAGVIDGLKTRFPKATEFVEGIGKYWDEFKTLAKTKVRAFWNGLFINTKSIKIGADWVDDTEYTKLGQALSDIRAWWNNKVKGIFDLKWFKGVQEGVEGAQDVQKAGKFAKVIAGINRVVGWAQTVGRFITGAVDWVVSGFKAVAEVGGTVMKVLGIGGGGGTLARILGGATRFIGKILKPILGKLPYIGFAMGLGFAYARFQKGEVLPATLELISAILTFVPGIGTIGSIIIDGALMLYDMDKQKKEDAAKGIKPGEGGFMSKIGKWVSDWIVPVLRYLPVIGSIFYFADSIKAFTNKDMFNGIDNLLKGLIAIVGGKGLVDLINTAYPLIMGFFSGEKQEEPAAAGQKQEGFWSNLKAKVSEFLLPKLKYIPVIGSFFYGKEAWEAFTNGQWGTGFLKVGQALVALIGGPVGTLVNLGIDFISSLFTEKEEPAAEVQQGEGGFLSKVKAMFAEKVMPMLKYLPVIGSFFYGKEAWDAFNSGQWGTGFVKLGQALVALVGGPIGSAINLGIDFITSIFSSEPTQEQEVKTQGGGFAAAIKGAFDAMIGIVTGAIDKMISWVKDTFASITTSVAEGVNAAMAIIPGGKAITAAGEAIAKAVIPEPADLTASNDPQIAAAQARQKRMQETAVKYGYTDKQQAAQAAGYANAAEWEKAGLPAPRPATIAAAAAPAATPSMVAAPTPQPQTTLAQAAAPSTTPSMVPTPQAPGAPAAMQAATPAATNRTENLTPTTDPNELTKRAKAKGWETKEQYKAWGWRSREEVMVEVKDRGWNTIEEYKAANFKPNPNKAPAVSQAAAPPASSPPVSTPNNGELLPPLDWKTTPQPGALPSNFSETVAATPPAATPAVTQAATPPAATPPQNTKTATGAATAGIMSVFGISQQPSAPTNAQQAGTPAAAIPAAAIPPSTGGTQARNFKGGQREAYALARSLAARAGSPDPDTTASIVMLESGWLKSSMIRRANNPSGQTITRGQIGKDGIVGGTVGADGQLHAVYANLEAAFAHHVKRWGRRYVANDVATTTKNLVAGGYNTVNPMWASHVQNTYRRWSGKALPEVAQGALSGAAPAIQASAPAASPAPSSAPVASPAPSSGVLSTLVRTVAAVPTASIATSLSTPNPTTTSPMTAAAPAAAPGVQGALSMTATSGSPLAQTYQATAPSASTTPSSPIPAGSSSMESIADFTFRKEAQFRGGKLAVYKPPAGDGGGAFEVAGITARYQPKEAAELKAMIEAGRHQEAEAKAKLFFAKRAEPFIKFTNRAGIQLQLTDIVHNRGEGGLRSILQRATGMTGEKSYQKMIEALNADPQALEKLHKARVAYEMEVVDRGRASRAKFRQGLMNRFNAAYTASQQIETRGGAATAAAPAAATPAMTQSAAPTMPSIAATPAASAPAAPSFESTAAAPTMPSIAATPAAAPSSLLSTAPAAPSSAGTLSAAAAPVASTPSPIPGGFDQYFNSASFGAALAARGNVGARQIGGSWKSTSGTTLCAAGAMVVAGMYTKSDAIKKARIGSATNLARNPNNPLTSTGIYKDMGALPQSYAPVDGDFVAMAGGSKGFGHALVYIGGKWYAHKSGDNTPQQYLSSGKYNSARLYRLTQAAAASASVPDSVPSGGAMGPAPAVAGTTGEVASPGAAAPASFASSLTQAISSPVTTLASGASSVSQAIFGGKPGTGDMSSGISLGASGTAPAVTAGAESTITNTLQDIASEQSKKKDLEISILQEIDKGIKDLAKYLKVPNTTVVNNGGDSGKQTRELASSTPDVRKQFESQTSGGLFGGKLFGFG